MTGALWPLKRSRSRLILTSITICTCWSFLWIISYLYLSMERLRKPWLRNTPSNIQVETLVCYVNWITEFTLLLLIHGHPGWYSAINKFLGERDNTFICSDTKSEFTCYILTLILQNVDAMFPLPTKKRLLIVKGKNSTYTTQLYNQLDFY